jgi:spermidine synthase
MRLAFSANCSEFYPHLIKPFEILAEVSTPDGSRIRLHKHDGEFYIKHNGRQLMSTIATVSELLLADIGCRHLRNLSKPRVLIGGLGLGYTLKRVLEIVGPGAVVHVSELLPEIVQWNRDFLRGVNGSLIEDPRVKVIIKDVFDVIRGAKGEHAYDSILLDTDHTPSSWVQSKNSRLYERAGFNWVTRALRANGLVAYWSAGAEPDFVHNLSRAGFRVQTYEAKAHPTAKRAVHRIYLGQALPKALPSASEAEPEKAQSRQKPVAPKEGTYGGKSFAQRKTPTRGRADTQHARRLERIKKGGSPFVSPAFIEGLEKKARRKAESKPRR